MSNIDLSQLITPEQKFEQLRQAKLTAVKQHVETLLQQGFPFEAGAGLGIQHLQTRDERDSTNWLTSQAAYQAQILAGNGSEVGAAFRTAENNTVYRSYQAAYELLLQLAAWGAALYQISWAKQDAIRTVTTATELAAISVEEGWDL